MKSIITTFLLFALIISSLEGISKSKYKSYSQRKAVKKGYIGLTIGSVIPPGATDTKVGVYSSWDFGYIFGNNLGINANTYSAYHRASYVGTNPYLLKIAFLVGPSYRIKINDRINWDLKASFGLMVSGIANNQIKKIIGPGWACNLGTSIRYNMWKKMYMGLNIGYLIGEGKDIFSMKDMSVANIGIGCGWLLK